MSDQPALQLFYAGKLTDAIAAAADEVRKKPTDIPARAFLAELLCFAGDLERADKQLDLIAEQDPTQGFGVALVRQLMRADQARQQLYVDGRVPEFNEQPSERLQLLLQATIAMREKQDAEAAELIVKANDLAPALEGECDEKPFVGFRDVDDLTATVFEVLTRNGKYYWVPMEEVERIDFEPHRRPRDLLWREVKMVMRGGAADAEVYLPVLYAGASKEGDERVRLGQVTDWRGGEGKALRGVGQRLYQVGEDDVPVMQFKTLTLRPVGAKTE